MVKGTDSVVEDLFLEDQEDLLRPRSQTRFKIYLKSRSQIKYHKIDKLF